MGASREDELRDLLVQAKVLASKYYKLTQKPLGVTGEVAELEAAKHLGLRLAVARTAHFDADREVGTSLERFQIKGRAVSRDDPYRGRVSSIKTDGDFEFVLLVLLDQKTFDAIEIFQATRIDVAEKLDAEGSKARNERRSLGISQFRSIAQKVWDDGSVRPPVAPRLPGQTPRSIPAHAGPIGSLVGRLLMDPTLDYGQIVARVKLQFPAAQTSTKSVATTARDLRKNGIAVPGRIGISR